MSSHTSPARIFLEFMLVLLVAMLLAAIASPWMQALLSSVAQIPLHRVFSRVAMLGLIGGTWWLLRYRHRAQRSLLGFSRPWPQFFQRLLWGLLAGLALMALAVLPLFLLELRAWNLRAPDGAAAWLGLILKGLGSGLLVALIEESFFRGAMQGTLQRQGGMKWALIAVPLLYSALHFLGRSASVPHDAITAWSGFTVWRGLFAEFAAPTRILDAFLALYFVGLLLALVRQRWGDIAGCIGLHAGFVAVITVFRKISAPAPHNNWSFLVGSFDGLLGIWIAALTALACIAVWRTRTVTSP
jgi:uncharacterized protein